MTLTKTERVNSLAARLSHCDFAAAPLLIQEGISIVHGAIDGFLARLPALARHRGELLDVGHRVLLAIVRWLPSSGAAPVGSMPNYIRDACEMACLHRCEPGLTPRELAKRFRVPVADAARAIGQEPSAADIAEEQVKDSRKKPRSSYFDHCKSDLEFDVSELCSRGLSDDEIAVELLLSLPVIDRVRRRLEARPEQSLALGA